MERLPGLAENIQGRVLLISDEPQAAAIWGYSLQQMDLDVRLISVVDNVLEIWESFIPDMIIIEDFNEQIEEIAVCQQIRQVTVAPILFFTTQSSENYHMQVYQAGADECIPYAVTPRIFQAKVKAWLQRTRSLPLAAVDQVHVGAFVLSPDHKQVSLPGGKVVNLTVLETRLLYLLLTHAGEPLLKEELIQRVWGHHTGVDQRLLKNHIYRLRQKIEPDPCRPRWLVNVGYRGYKFQAQPPAQSSAV